MFSLAELGGFPSGAEEVTSLCAALRSLEPRLVEDDPRHRRFFAALAVLAADYLTAGCDLVGGPRGGGRELREASALIASYLLKHLRLGHGALAQGFAVKDYLYPLGALCSGSPALEKSEQSALFAVLMETAAPFADVFETTKDSLGAVGLDAESPVTATVADAARPQTDLTPMFIGQLITPIEKDSHAQEPTDPELDKGNCSRHLRLSFANRNIQHMHSRDAGDILIDLCSSLPLLSTYVGQWNDATTGEGTRVAASYAEAMAHKQTFQELVSEINATWKALTIPVLEPLTANRIAKLCKVIMGCLLASVSVATTQSILSLNTNLNTSSSSSSSQPGVTGSSSKDQELDLYAIEIIEKSLELFNSTLSLLRESTRAGGHILQNFTVMGAWVLTTGLLVQLTNTSQVTEKKDSKAKDQSSLSMSRINLIKAQQGFGVLSVALGSQALSLTASLLEDVASEVTLEDCATLDDDKNSSSAIRVEPATFDLFHPFTATQRTALVFNSVPFVQLLFNVAIISYRKSCNLKCLASRVALNRITSKSSVEMVDAPPISSMEDIDENSYSEEEEDVCSVEERLRFKHRQRHGMSRPHPNSPRTTDCDEDDDDDDSEPLLGRWFEETLFPAEEKSVAQKEVDDSEEKEHEEDGEGDLSTSGNIVPEKGEPAGFISLASHIFIFLNKHLLSSESRYVRAYLMAKVSEQQMTALAAITRDLDFESAATGQRMEYHLASLYAEFSSTLATFTHNLLAHGLLTERLQNSLLTQLSVSPWVDHHQQHQHEWPLRVYPRTLAVLTQVLLLRQSQDQEGGTSYGSSGRHTCVYINIWERAVASLVRHSLVPTPEGDSDDLNVEHAQLLLFVFHALALMQKKQVLLLTASGVVKASRAIKSDSVPLKTSQILHLSRLVLLLEYLMRHMYEPPKELMEQVQNNIFRRFLSSAASVLSAPPKYFPCHDLEACLAKVCPSDEVDFRNRPRFYDLFAPSDLPSVQEVPKLDGLACSFLLGTADVLQYRKVYQALITLLQVVHQADIRREEDDAYEAMVSTQYCFNVCWRLLQSLPPSVEFLEGLVSPQANRMPACTMLHGLILCPRTGHKVLGTWIRDSLVKQGQTTAKAENLLKNVSTTINRLSYDVKILKQLLRDLSGRGYMSGVTDRTLAPKEMPSFVDLLLLDVIMSKIQISLDVRINCDKKESGGLKATASDPVELSEAVAAAHELIPLVSQLVVAFSASSRAYVVNSMKKNTANDATSPLPLDENTRTAVERCLKVCGTKCPVLSELATQLSAGLAPALKARLHEWNEASLLDFSPTASWRNQSLPDLLPCETYINVTIKTHISTLSLSLARSNLKSLKRCLYSVARFACDLYAAVSDDGRTTALVASVTSEHTSDELARVLFPLTMDACAENLADLTALALQSHFSSQGLHDTAVYKKAMESLLPILLDAKKYQATYLSEEVLCEIVSFFERALDSDSGRAALTEVLRRPMLSTVSHATSELGADLARILLTVGSEELSPDYSSAARRFLCHLLELCERQPEEALNEVAVPAINTLLRNQDEVRHWMETLVKGPEDSNDSALSNGFFLLALARFAGRSTGPVELSVGQSLLHLLLSFGQEALSPTNDGMAFTQLFAVMCTVATEGGNLDLFEHCLQWLGTCKNYLVQKNVIEKLAQGIEGGKHMIMVENTSHILNYIYEFIWAAKIAVEDFYGSKESALSFRPTSPTEGGSGESGGVDHDNDCYWLEDGSGLLAEEEDSGAEDSDDESLCNKLCTYTQTQKEFMNQHWYHCHTCKMVDGIGVCTVCAKVCHAGHDVTYSKFGSFFCDCGDREDGSCRALVRRSPQYNANSAPGAGTSSSSCGIGGANRAGTAPEDLSRGRQRRMEGMQPLSAYGFESILASSLRRRGGGSSALVGSSEEAVALQQTGSAGEKGTPTNSSSSPSKVPKQVRELASWMISSSLHESGRFGRHHEALSADLLELLTSLLPVLEAIGAEKYSSVGRLERVQAAIHALHTIRDKIVEQSEQLVSATLGSQEGAFENVRMNYSGDQGQTIRQLMNNHMLRRVVMCCLSSGGKRQHLAVAHEKGKITVLQLSALLRQADSAQKKLTLTRLSSAPVPFTVLSVASNPANENYLAVTGLKDCHILTFNPSGSVSDHLVLHPQLDANNFIVKTLWMPGSQTELALVTADFVKIYDLGRDVLSPQYYFLVPSGKVHDCTLAFLADGSRHVLLMSSAGHIYFQPLCAESAAAHGPFYVTNIMDVVHEELEDSSEQIGGGGVSLYYSHALRMLFFSYVHGKSFMAPLAEMTDELRTVYKLEVKQQQQSTPATPNSSSGPHSSASKNSNNAQPLCQWNEIHGHPGLITAFLQTSNNPVVIMVRPGLVMIQEIRVGPKIRIIDMVAIRHSSVNSERRTTLILLCEDGSLKIFMANPETTEFWLSPGLRPVAAIAQIKPPRRRRAAAGMAPGFSGVVGRGAGNVSFPVDFFESCSQISDVEFGGNDVLQVYNVHQIKHRLQTSGLYIANTKVSGFCMDVINNDPSQVIVGVRVLLGSKDIARVPSTIEVFGRSISVNLNRPRWYDLPLTREESLQSDQRLTITFGSSHDPAGVSFLDCVQVHGKNKEAFGWPEDQDESLGSGASGGGGGNCHSGFASTGEDPTDPRLEVAGPMSKVEQMAVESLEALRYSLHASTLMEHHRQTATTRSDEEVRAVTLDLASQLATLPACSQVEHLSRCVLAALFPAKSAYAAHRDAVLLRNAAAELDGSTDGGCGGVEHFHCLLLTARSVAVSRPANLIRFAEEREELSIQDNDGIRLRGRQRFMQKLVNWFWTLLESRPVNSAVGMLGMPGITHVEASVQALIEILHAFASHDHECASFVASFYAGFLVAESTQVSFAAKQALNRVLRPKAKRRKVFIPSPPYCATPPLPPAPDPPSDQQNRQDQEQDDDLQFHDAIPMQGQDVEGALNVGPGGVQLGGIAGNLDALLPMAAGGGGAGGASLPAGIAANLPGMLEAMSGEVDDEAMVELAIALSLQEQDAGGAGPEQNLGGNLPPGLAGLQQGLEQLVNLENLPALRAISGMLGGAIGGLTDDDVDMEQSGAGGGAGAGGGGVEGVRDEEDEEEGGVPQEPAHFSDATASAPGSDDDDGPPTADDDDDDNPARDGGLVAPPEQDQEGGSGGGSESGTSVIESLGGEQTISGHSSGYEVDTLRGGGGGSGVNIGEGAGTGNATDTNFTDEAEEGGATNLLRLHALRLLMLEELLKHFPRLRDVGGVRSIPFMQVLLMLTTDLDSKEERDRVVLDKLLKTLIEELNIQRRESEDKACERSNLREMQLVVLRFFSVLMSRSKSWQGTKQSSSSEPSNFVSHATSQALLRTGCVEHCLAILNSLLDFWRKTAIEDQSMKVGSSLLKNQSLQSPPDMSPFFLKQYVKGHAHDVFEAYPQLLTEMALRLPYQIKKLTESESVSLQHEQHQMFGSEWHETLCEYMLTQQTPYVRRQVRKLLLYICGSKEKYRELRDLHLLGSHLRDVRAVMSQDEEASFPYDTLLTLIEHLKACVDVSALRTQNWRKFCLHDDTVLAFLFKISFILEDGVSPIILQLLQNAICSNAATGATQQRGPESSASSTTSSRLSRGGRSALKGGEKSKLEDTDESELEESTLVRQVNQLVSTELLFRFVEKFLLECNSTSVRWQAHSLIVTLHCHSAPRQQEEIADILWRLWRQLPLHGRKAAQFVDLLGYFSMKTLRDEDQIAVHVQQAVDVLKAQNIILANHPNSNIYGGLSHLVDFHGYYLESDPCLVCNNPEVPYTTLKLSALKVDTKYTTTTHIVKLASSHSISKIALRIGDLKRQKMVRTINIYYNNRSVGAVVELKNRPTMWHRARKVSLTAGQTDVKVEFPLPIVACNLMVEYADFYENIQASSETLQCPRCSASVPANPGVCANCGENVFQCHKCRSINYDEKDPFLCNICGFCKYAKFEYTLNCRPCCAVDPIENEEDRKKAIASINALLDKADKVYRQLIGNRPQLESLLLKVSASGSEADGQEGGSSTQSNSTSHVNMFIQQLAQRYCGDCKSAFEELSKIIQKVIATRKELLAFDNSKKAGGGVGGRAYSQELTGSGGEIRQVSGRCYGCAAASVEHCLTLLRALATKPRTRHLLFEQGLIPELLQHNLRRGTNSIRAEVHRLISYLTKDNSEATAHLNSLLYGKISLSMNGGTKRTSYSDMVGSVREEMNLLAYTVQREDTCWEERLKTVFRLFLVSTREEIASPVVMECVTLPCLKILQGLIKPAVKVRKGKEDSSGAATHRGGYQGLSIDIEKWLAGDPEHCFAAWDKRSKRPASAELQGTETASTRKKKKKEEVRRLFVAEKFYRRWHEKTFRKVDYSLDLTNKSWLRSVLFSQTSRTARQTTCAMIETFCTGSHERKRDVVDLLTGFLHELGRAGEAAAEFCELYSSLVTRDQDYWRHYLAIKKNVLTILAQLVMDEINQLEILEETTLGSDLAQGFALKTLTDILASFLSVERIKAAFKGRLVSSVLHGYLSLRRLVVQRTKLVDQTQERLLELLEDMTTGTLEETKAFMSVCVQTIKRYPDDDQLTPVFIFERLCNIIFPEEADTGEFLMTLEKDQQQEDFLQGRMLGNPYSSNDADMGPLMREIKNKICRDCELVALLEDDNGMELLVNNKIISLDLPVKDVYQKVWLPEVMAAGGGIHEGLEPMRIIYRMRGLLGDATEEFIETLENKESEDQDEEEVYKLANVMADCGGLEVMLSRMESVADAKYSRQMLAVLLKLFGYCIKVEKNRSCLLNPNLKTVPILLRCLELCLAAGETQSSPASGPSIAELILQIMERLLVEAAAKTGSSIARYIEFASSGVSISAMKSLLSEAVHLRSGTEVHSRLLRVLPFLTYGDRDKMSLVIGHFDDVTDFDAFDAGHGAEDEAKVQAFVAMCDGIERNQIGNTLKAQMLELGVVDKCISYIEKNAPPISAVVTKTEDPLWKEFVTKPSLRYILQMLAGLATEHEQTQMNIADHCIPNLHQMEQVSSEEHVGSLAEAVLEALRGCPAAEAKVAAAREQTKAEKKKLAMAMRAKQLQAFGLKANAMGQVKADVKLLQKFVDLAEESGLLCSICREGYKFQPGKVLAIYTFTLPCPVDECEVISGRKTMGYTTVSHFNLVHVDCHSAAVRQARGRDEWESALLQNANTRCNGLLPVWGPGVAESAFASALARHNTYLSEATGHRDIGFTSSVQDIKLLLLRFAEDRSFSAETGGGGPQSNLHLLPYLAHAALYVLNTTRAVAREEKALTTFIESLPRERWADSAFAAEGPAYYTALALLVAPPSKWRQIRIRVLERLLLTAHYRVVHTRPPKNLVDRSVKDYAAYKKFILFFALVDQLFDGVVSAVPGSSNAKDATSWTTMFAEWIRHNDDALIKSTSKVLRTFQDDLLSATSFDEIIDVCGLLGEIPSPTSFLIEVLNLVP